MEEYFSADRLVQLNIGSVIHIDDERSNKSYRSTLVGVAVNHCVIMSLPCKTSLPEGTEPETLFQVNDQYEVKTVQDGRVIAFETKLQEIYKQRLLIGSFPEMIETRRLREAIRFPCALSCDMNVPMIEGSELYGAITNISEGGCQLSIPNDTDYSIIEKAIENNYILELQIFFPFYEESIKISANIRSSQCETDGNCSVGVSFCRDYDCIRQYLESLQLDSVSPFFY
jgi:c-di-GMP-binding flagellar brake protein YcgR